jgi:hypothetical protein
MGLNDTHASRDPGEVAVKTIAAASVTAFDITGPDSDGRVLVPCREIIINSRTSEIQFAEKEGEIEAGRYLTIIGSLHLNGARNGKFWMKAVGADSDVEIYTK